MTCTIRAKKGWTLGIFDHEDQAVYFADTSVVLPTPQAVLDYAKSDTGKALNLGPSGLIFMHFHRTRRGCVSHYFQSIAAANRFHKSLSAR